MKQTKTELRKRLRAKRAALSPDEQARAARRLAAKLFATRLFLCSRRIACYLANDGEIETSEIIAHIWRMRKICYLPVLSRINGNALWFARLEPETELMVNRYGILEPIVLPRELVRARKLDLVLLPLVGFDRRGNRLGMGGGFYDRSLAFLRHRTVWKKPHLVGLAHDLQQVDRLEPSPWDVAIDGVVTDKDLYLVP